MIFNNRYQAGELLAKKLSKFQLSPQNSVIAAIPRGGVVVAQAIFNILKIPLYAVIIKKLGAPLNPELAIGATASYGKPVLDRWLIADLKVTADYLKKEILKKKKEARKREIYLRQISSNKFKGKTVIVVDDGLATGQTAKAAAKIIKADMPSKLILAIPCAAPTTIDYVKTDFDEVVCLDVDPNLMAVGQFYRDFRPVTDEEVKNILAQRTWA